jgi:hypothetical protein
MIYEPQIRFVTGIIISEYQFSTFIMVLVRITDFFDFLFRVDVFSDLQNRSIHQDNLCFVYYLF